MLFKYDSSCSKLLAVLNGKCPWTLDKLSSFLTRLPHQFHLIIALLSLFNSVNGINYKTTVWDFFFVDHPMLHSCWWIGARHCLSCSHQVLNLLPTINLLQRKGVWKAAKTSEWKLTAVWNVSQHSEVQGSFIQCFVAVVLSHVLSKTLQINIRKMIIFSYVFDESVTYYH